MGSGDYAGNPETSLVWLAGIACLLLGTLASAQERVIPVTIATVDLAPISEELPLTGSVTSPRFSRLSPQVSGQVMTIHVDDGTRVTQGQIVLELDRRIAEIELASATAAYEESRAQYAEAIRQRDEAANLLAKQHIATTVFKETEAQVEIRAAESRRLAAERDRRANLLAFHSLPAPYDGVIGKKLVEVGEWVQAGTPVAELIQLDVLRIEVPVPQAYFSQIQVGAPVRIEIDALPGHPIEARISVRIPVSSFTARTFPVFILLDNQEGRIAPGMSARVLFSLDLADQPDVMQLSRDAIVRSPDGSQTVWRVSEESDGVHVEPVTVSTGRSFRHLIEILDSDLNPGDIVVLQGNENLRPNQKVRIIDRRADSR